MCVNIYSLYMFEHMYIILYMYSFCLCIFILYIYVNLCVFILICTINIFIYTYKISFNMPRKITCVFFIAWSFSIFRPEHHPVKTHGFDPFFGAWPVRKAKPRRHPFPRLAFLQFWAEMNSSLKDEFVVFIISEFQDMKERQKKESKLFICWCTLSGEDEGFFSSSSY